MNQSSLISGVMLDETIKNLVQNILESADDRKSADPVVLDVSEISYLSDFFVILTGYSRAQVRAICDSIEERLESQFGRKPIRLEGKQDASWILMDYGVIIVHIFLPTEREYYNLEAFWGHAARISFTP